MECALRNRRFHRGFTAAEKTELWDRWKRGESLKAIGRAFGKPSSSIYFLVAPHGGIRPAQRRRSRLALTLAEREVICRGVTAHQSARSIAGLLGRSPSTVSREMSRNGGYNRYRAALADENAWARARRPKYCKLANNPRLRRSRGTGSRLWHPRLTQPFVQSFALGQVRWILRWAKQSQFRNRSGGRTGPQIVGKCSTRLVDATLHAVSAGQ